MHADELRMAVTKVVSLLDKSQIRAAVDQYRAAKGDQRTAAAARLGHAGALIMEKLDELTAEEALVVKCLHLNSMSDPDYWKSLLDPSSGSAGQHQAEIVRLASRVMFATNHLPAMMSLLRASDEPRAGAVDENLQFSALPQIDAGEGALYIRLTDAGERASDPDRIARAIDGVDMLYSACASIARKPAMDLRLDAVTSRQNRDRDFRFTGERDSISAVYAVIDSIPAALANIDPNQDIDLHLVIDSLPVFQDLNTLASLGTFSSKDLKDISETMHQGALLILESGVILVDDESALGGGSSGVTAAGSAFVPGGKPVVSSENGSAAERDEHYNRYLLEREAMRQAQQTGGTGGVQAAADRGAEALGSSTGLDTSKDEDARQDAVDELLKSLGQSRTT